MRLSATALLMLAMTALPAGAFASDRKEWCDVTSIIAEASMLSRQGGVELSDQIDMTVQTTKPGSRMRAAYLIMAHAAHNLPIMDTEAEKRKAAAKFRDQWYFDCLDGVHD